MLAILGTLGIVLAVVAVGLWVDRRVSLLPRPEELAAGPAEAARKKKELHAPGSAPETAITGDTAAIASLARGQRHCRTRMTREPDDTVRYGDEALTVLRFRCDRCGARARVYVRPAPS
jgi:hypothetical protein